MTTHYRLGVVEPEALALLLKQYDELRAENEAIRTAWEQERSVSDGLAQKLAELESQESECDAAMKGET